MLFFTFVDQTTKFNAVEIKHIPLFDDEHLLPGMKIQLKNVKIRDKMMLLTPEVVLWCGGQYKPFADKFIKTGLTLRNKLASVVEIVRTNYLKIQSFFLLEIVEY